MIENFDREHFAETLHQHLSPTKPIQSEENLRGRSAQVSAIEEGLYAPGRTVFIFGDRGVGKTSLAQTVAFRHQASTREPVFLACGADTTFSSLIWEAYSRLRGTEVETSTRRKAHFGVTAAGVEVEKTVLRRPLEQADVIDLNSAVSLLQEVENVRREDIVVVVDEFDRLSSSQERGKFADLIKQIGDQSIRVRFVFCGVGDSLVKLLGDHASAFRYIQAVKVGRLPWEARLEIIDNAAKALRVGMEDRPRLRIAAISDGFPYYVHLVCEKLFWELFNDSYRVLSPAPHHYQRAVAASVESIELQLQQAYEKATMKAAEGYEGTLWAVADHADLKRKTDSIFQSYLHIMDVFEQPPLERPVFISRLANLKRASSSQILSSYRPAYYEFTESIMRGYVRLRAEAVGLELASDFEGGTAVRSTWIQKSARRPRPGMTRDGWRKTQYPID